MEQRYEPLPGLLGLPGFVWRRTPRPARIALAVFACGAVVGTAIAVPLIASGKREGAERERRAEAIAKAQEERRLRIDQTPHHGRAADAPSAPAAARHAAITAAVERAITADARARYSAHRLPGPPVKETVCSAHLTELADLQPAARRAGGAVLGCLAATTVGVRPGGTRFAIGFEFLAAANWRRATFTWCKTNPPPGEKFGGVRRAEVKLGRGCADPSQSS
jgi:hypothetical protein